MGLCSKPVKGVIYTFASRCHGSKVRGAHCADNLDELPVCILPFVVDDVRDSCWRHAEDSAQFLLGEVF